MNTWSCYTTELLSWEKNQVNIATGRYSMSYPFFVAVDLFTRCGKLSEFIQSDVPSNYWYQMNSDIWIRRSKIRNIRITRNTTFAGNREAGARNRITTRITYLFACFLPFLYRCNLLFRNISSITILVHRISDRQTPNGIRQKTKTKNKKQTECILRLGPWP